MTAPAFLVLPNSIIVVLNNKRYEANQTHPRFNEIKDAITTKQYDILPGLFSVTNTIQTFVGEDSKVEIKNGKIYWNNEEIHNYLTTRILQTIKEKLPYEPLMRFFEKVMVSTQYSVRNELFQFLEYAKLPITEDGDFLAYKKVRHDYKSIYDGETPNEIGTRVEMPRGNVNDDRNITCSYGLHFCSHSYLRHFGSSNNDDTRVLIVKINPADVVAIPNDYNNTKGRACGYEIIGELSPGIQQDENVLSEAPSIIVTEKQVPKTTLLKDAVKAGRVQYRSKFDDKRLAVKAYEQGYKHGRDRNQRKLQFATVDQLLSYITLHTTDRSFLNDSDFIERLSSAYDLGVRTGRGHKAKDFSKV